VAVVIRAAIAKDLPALQRIATQAYAPYVPRIGREPAPMTADYAADVTSGSVWVAVEDGEVLGLLVVHRRADHALLENVAVTPSAQGRVIGANLIAYAERLAFGWGLPEVRLYTNAAMTENLTYYPRLGYHETGRGEQDGFRRVFFSKSLR
jgi:N-acetylglutamate synthase-like GNAT family acetyltransferase